MKICNECKLNINPDTYQKRHGARCLECFNKFHNAVNQKYQDTHRKEKHKRERRDRGTWKGKFTYWKAQAKYRGFYWKLDLPFLQSLPFTCYYSGISLTLEVNHPHTVSIDRLDSSKDYTKDNVVLCCAMINVAKNHHSEKDFINMCIAVAKYKS